MSKSINMATRSNNSSLMMKVSLAPMSQREATTKSSELMSCQAMLDPTLTPHSHLLSSLTVAKILSRVNQTNSREMSSC